MGKQDELIEEGAPVRPKLLRLPMFRAAPDVVPARMVNEVLYCERLAYLEWAQKEFADNHFTIEGRSVAHRRVDATAQAPRPPDEEAPWKARSVWLTSERLGLTAKIDIVEARDGLVAPVEYKRGKKPRVDEGAWLPERAQLCAQVLLLRDHGYRCEEAWVWYAQGREKVGITIDAELERQTLAAIARVRTVVTGTLPPPLETDPKCRGCSLSGLCLPDEVNLLREPASGAVRRLHPSRDDRSAVYVQDQGSRVGVSKDRLVVTLRNGDRHEARIPNTSQLCVLGNVQISTQAIRSLLRSGIPIAFFTTGGWYLGRTVANDSNNVELKIAQYGMLDDEDQRRVLARTVVHNKILNQRTLLRRNHPGPIRTELFELKQLARKSLEAKSRASLLGLEGTAARVYFGAFRGMLKGHDLPGLDIAGRNRRPPRDPINALLSFAYAMLVKEWSIVLQLAGLDPLLGFFHEPRFGRPALALDLMEPFRPLVADSVVISAINNGEVHMKDFIHSPTGCAMRPRARKRMVAAFERRMAHTITHPVFGYSISYRRTTEVQARLFARHLLGDIPAYPELRTR